MSRLPIVAVTVLLAVSAPAAPAAAPKRDYRAAMRDFVVALSTAAKKADPAFLVVPQGGLALLTDTGEPDGRPDAAYLKAIDGVGQEEVFYGFDNRDNRETPRKETDAFLALLAVAKAAGKPVLATDYAGKKGLIDDAYARGAAAGLVSFVADRRGLDRIPKYPEKPVGENADDVRTLKDARNFLYLIDGGRLGSKAKYLAALAKTNHDLLILDPFAGGWTATADEIKPLKAKANGRRRLVLCYVSVGEAEDYRSYWKKGWKPGSPAFLGPENPQWKGSYAVRYWDLDWQAVFLGGEGSYLARVQKAGFDGVYLDKVDEFEWFEGHGE
jgi:cysteinyl-tRNA synthetase